MCHDTLKCTARTCSFLDAIGVLAEQKHLVRGCAYGAQVLACAQVLAAPQTSARGAPTFRLDPRVKRCAEENVESTERMVCQARSKTLLWRKAEETRSEERSMKQGAKNKKQEAEQEARFSRPLFVGPLFTAHFLRAKEFYKMFT